MKASYLNHDSRYGRFLFSIESDHLIVATGSGRTRREARHRLDRLESQFERKSQRFVGPGIKGIVIAVGLAFALHELMSLASAFDEVVDFPIAQFYGYLFGGIFIGSLLVHSFIGFLKVETVDCRSFDDQFCARFFLTRKEKERVEQFLGRLANAIEEAKERKKAQPGATDNPGYALRI